MSQQAYFFGCVADLRSYIDSALGQNGNKEMIDRLTDEIRCDVRNRPSFIGNEDWAPYLESLNLWAMVESWEKE